jgi:hypothetical protein
MYLTPDGQQDWPTQVHVGKVLISLDNCDGEQLAHLYAEDEHDNFCHVLLNSSDLKDLIHQSVETLALMDRPR